MLMLDTNAVIALFNGKPAVVRERFKAAKASGADIVISSIVLFELNYGVAKSTRRAENAERLRVFLSGPVEVIAFDEDDAAAAGDIRAKREALGTPIGPWDVLIAAQALRHDATLITANTSEFARVDGLKTENWST